MLEPHVNRSKAILYSPNYCVRLFNATSEVRIALLECPTLIIMEAQSEVRAHIYPYCILICVFAFLEANSRVGSSDVQYRTFTQDTVFKALGNNATA